MGGINAYKRSLAEGQCRLAAHNGVVQPYIYFYVIHKCIFKFPLYCSKVIAMC